MLCRWFPLYIIFKFWLFSPSSSFDILFYFSQLWSAIMVKEKYLAIPTTQHHPSRARFRSRSRTSSCFAPSFLMDNLMEFIRVRWRHYNNVITLYCTVFSLSPTLRFLRLNQSHGPNLGHFFIFYGYSWFLWLFICVAIMFRDIFIFMETFFKEI